MSEIHNREYILYDHWLMPHTQVNTLSQEEREELKKDDVIYDAMEEKEIERSYRNED